MLLANPGPSPAGPPYHNLPSYVRHPHGPGFASLPLAAAPPKLGARGIGVSVLCPGFIRTRIMESARAIPERLAGRVALADPTALPNEFAKVAIAAIENGIDPLYVGELVVEGIEGDWPYIFTDTDFEGAVDARFAEIKAGFDRIRARTPRR